MSKMYSDPTASAAIGSLDKELNRMDKKVKELRARSRFPTALVRRRFDAAMAAPEEPEQEEAAIAS